MKMTKLEQIYEGKAKKVFRTDDPAYCVVEYKDDATAFNGLKKGTILGKGAVNNRMTNLLMQMLEQQRIPTHFVKELSQNYGVEEGIVFDEPTIEFSYKNDALGDPLINSYHARALKLATGEEIDTIVRLAFQVNEALKAFFLSVGIRLVDFKLEFGRTGDGTIVLADEISPDTCRLWDKDTNEKLDKDRFRRDLGHVESAYQEVMRRLLEKQP